MERRKIYILASAILWPLTLLNFAYLTQYYIPLGSDLPQDYCAGLSWLKHGLIYGSSVRDECVATLGFVNIENYHPPFYTLLVLPLTSLPYAAGVWLWNLINLVALVFAVVQLVRTLNLPSHFKLLLPALVLLWNPAAENFSVNHSAGLLTLFVVLCWKFLRTDRDVAAGCVLAIASLMKLYPALLLLQLLAARRVKALVSFCLTVAVGMTLCVAVFGIPEVQLYFTEIIGASMSHWALSVGNLSLRGIVASLFTVTPWTTPVFDLSPYFSILLILFQAALVALILWCVFRASHRGQEELSFCVLLIGALLLSPLSWGHALLLSVVPIGVVLKEGRGSKKINWMVILAVCFGMLPSFEITRLLQSELNTVKIPFQYLWLIKGGSVSLLLLLFAGLYCISKPVSRNGAPSLPYEL